MHKQKRIVVLFSRLSDYMVNTFSKYVESSNNQLFVYKKEPINSEAPFMFNLENKKVLYKNENNYNQNELLNEVKAINPDLIICSGWSNRKYLNIVRNLHKQTPCILTMDNQWLGTLKQHIGAIYANLYLKPLFHKIWIPGNAQVSFAKKLGFSETDIIKGWYVANSKFSFDINHTTFNKRFVFVGRYVAIKGILDLIESFITLKNTTSLDWELHCYGTGTLVNSLPVHKDIIHHGFMQPTQLFEEAKKGGVFVLPSHFEPWGLVVQEFALAGYPLLVSDKVGAAVKFVKDDNGFIFEAKNQESLIKGLRFFTLKSKDELIAMARKSQEYGNSINAKQWNNSLDKILNNLNN